MDVDLLGALFISYTVFVLINTIPLHQAGADLGGGCRGCAPPKMTCGFLIQLVFWKKKPCGCFGVEVEQETSAPSPKKKILDPPLPSKGFVHDLDEKF